MLCFPASMNMPKESFSFYVCSSYLPPMILSCPLCWSLFFPTTSPSAFISLCVPQYCRATKWNNGYITVQDISPSLSNHHLNRRPQRAPPSTTVECWQVRSWADNHSCYVMLCPMDSLSQHSTPSICFYVLFLSSFSVTWALEWVTEGSHSGLSIQQYSYPQCLWQAVGREPFL